MDAEMELIDRINRMSGRYSGYEIFSDWVKMSALSIANSCLLFHGRIWKHREQEYLDTAHKYRPEELDQFCEMFGLLADALTEDIRDVLGDIYMRAGLGSKLAGQFFTPFHVSELCARLDIAMADPNSRDPITLLEPSCGGGGMVIAAAKTLQGKGVDFQRRLRVVAQDLDWKGVYMCYLQLSLLGIRARVVQGDTLCEPYDPGKTDPMHILITPAEMMGGLP